MQWNIKIYLKQITNDELCHVLLQTKQQITPIKLDIYVSGNCNKLFIS